VRALVLIALVALSLSPQGGDGAQFAIAVDVDFVVFNVTVTDSRGRLVAGLKASDFQIRENNRVQELKLFGAENAPATIGLVIDNSGSMQNKRANVVNAALAFASASHSEDETFVVHFNEKVFFSLPPSIPFTSNPDHIRSALQRTSPDGMTALYDALAASIDHLKTGTRDRKALVVLSDGGDNASRRDLDAVLEIAKRSSATIYTIGIYDESNMDRNPKVLRRIADLSGGRAFFPESPNDLERVWRDVEGAIRSQYTIGYHSTDRNRDGKFRKVEITAGRNSRRDLRVVTRDGYVALTDERIVR
jgi:Ca-activated chloride channel family protein